MSERESGGQIKPNLTVATKAKLSSMNNFSEIYSVHFNKLHRFATDFIHSEEAAHDIVQDIFIELWNNKEHLEDIKSMNAYLFRLVKNRCLDHLKHLVHEKNYEEYAVWEYNSRIESLSLMTDDYVIANEMSTLVKNAVNNLPPRCKEIFLLSRINGMKHSEIAGKLNLSENTVGVQLGIALRRIRAVTDKYFNA